VGKFSKSLFLGAIATFAIVSTSSAQEEPLCFENSPERKGEIGCSIIETKPLPESLQERVFWHIDRFENGETARAAVGPASITFQAHGSWWLMTIESQSGGHGGEPCRTSKAFAPATSAEVFDACHLSLHTIWNDLACPFALRSRSILRR
jgi:hypothetical protein